MYYLLYRKRTIEKIETAVAHHHSVMAYYFGGIIFLYAKINLKHNNTCITLFLHSFFKEQAERFATHCFKKKNRSLKFVKPLHFTMLISEEYLTI